MVKHEHKLNCANCLETCCVISYVQLTPKEAKYFKKDAKKFNDIWFLRSVNKKCLFFKKDVGCILEYSIRPLSCRLYPITFYLEDNKAKVFVDKNCLLYDKSKIIKYKKLIKEAKAVGLDMMIAVSESPAFEKYFLK